MHRIIPFVLIAPITLWAQVADPFGGGVDSGSGEGGGFDSLGADPFADASPERGSYTYSAHWVPGEPMQVEMNVIWVGFPLEEIAGHADIRTQGMLSQEAVLKLWEEGAGELLDFQKMVTLSGVNAQIEQVKEVIYPTEFGAGAGVTNTAAKTPPVPGAFEVREVGGILNITPTVASDVRVINLALIPERVELKEFAQHETRRGEEVLSVSQPTFISNNLTTSLVVIHDRPLVVYTGRHPVEKRIDAVIVRVRSLTASGEKIIYGEEGEETE